ncbi:ABC_transp_aux domain-containing protein [Gammaproteobacteria bacterium]
MQVTSRTRLQLRLQNTAFVVLFLTVVGLLAGLSTRYTFQADWTATGRHTLNPASVTLLARLSGMVEVTAFAKDLEPLRRPITEFVERYRRYKPDLRLAFVNPETAPDRTRALGIRTGGEIVVEYQGRTERLTTLNEQAMTNALERLARGGERFVVFLQGHGERDAHGKANADLSSFARALQSKGLRVTSLNLTSAHQVPDNTGLLVIAEPRVDWLPGEVTVIRDYLGRGGNLLWLVEPGPLHGLEPLAQTLGVELPPGTVVDPSAVRLFGAAYALGARYYPHPVTRDFDMVTLFPIAAALRMHPSEGWHAEPLVESSEDSWLESGQLSGTVAFNPGTDIRGPLLLAVAITRPTPAAAALPSIHTEPESSAGAPPLGPEQRVIVFGDGDFLSDAFVGNGGNLDLGLNLVNWLVHDENLINIPARVAPDTSLNFSPTLLLVLAGGFLILMPLVLVGTGVAVWWRRRKA